MDPDHASRRAFDGIDDTVQPGCRAQEVLGGRMNNELNHLQTLRGASSAVSTPQIDSESRPIFQDRSRSCEGAEIAVVEVR